MEYTNGKYGFEKIKYEDDSIKNRKGYEKRWNKARKWAKKRGILFVVLTEKRIRTARRENIWFTLGTSKGLDNHRYMSKLNALIPTKRS
ncbi:MAG: hypothetical protein ACFFG0_55325 [Candidatus Thorarchaeota archaeon]